MNENAEVLLKDLEAFLQRVIDLKFNVTGDARILLTRLRAQPAGEWERGMREAAKICNSRIAHGNRSAECYEAERCAKAILARTLEHRAAEAERTFEERFALKFAAIMTVSIQNTREAIKQRISVDNPYWTVAYSDVCAAVDREIRERERAEEAERRLAEARPSAKAVAIAKWALDPNYEESTSIGDGIKVVLRELLRLAAQAGGKS